MSRELPDDLMLMIGAMAHTQEAARPLLRAEIADAIRAFAEEAVRLEREACAKAVEALRDDHCKSTQCDPDPDGHCLPNDNLCDFVCSWNDAAAAIRARSQEGQG